MPNWLAFKMRTLRPQIETGFEALLLMRLCVDEALAATRASRGERPLTPGEIAANWADMRDVLLARYGLPPEKAAEALGGARDAWLADDSEGWLDAHRFYPGAIEALQAALAADSGASEAVYIVTTKEERFAQTLLRHAGLKFADERVYGLDFGSKLAMLGELQREHAGSRLSFVEDRVETLRAVANEPRLFSCRLFFARWGYSDSEQQAAAAYMPRIRTLSDSSELAGLFDGGSGSDEALAKDWRDH